MKNFILQNLASEGPQKPQGRTCLIYQSKKEREEEGKTLSSGDEMQICRVVFFR